MRTVADSFATPPTSIGASLGGLATLLGCGEANDPASIARAVVLVDITPTVERAGVERIVNFMQERLIEGFANLDEVADYVAAYLPDRPRPKSTAGLEKNLRQRGGRWYWHWDPGFMKDIDARMDDRDPERLKAATLRLSMPALLVRGGKSDLVTPETAQEFVPETLTDTRTQALCRMLFERHNQSKAIDLGMIINDLPDDRLSRLVTKCAAQGFDEEQSERQWRDYLLHFQKTSLQDRIAAARQALGQAAASGDECVREAIRNTSAAELVEDLGPLNRSFLV